MVRIIVAGDVNSGKPRRARRIGDARKRRFGIVSVGAVGASRSLREREREKKEKGVFTPDGAPSFPSRLPARPPSSLCPPSSLLQRRAPPLARSATRDDKNATRLLIGDMCSDLAARRSDPLSPRDFTSLRVIGDSVSCRSSRHVSMGRCISGN